MNGGEREGRGGMETETKKVGEGGEERERRHGLKCVTFTMNIRWGGRGTEGRGEELREGEREERE